MRLRWKFDYQVIMAIICFAVFTFCLLKYFEPVEAAEYKASGYLNIPSIGLDSKTVDIDLEDGKLNTPSTIIGSYSRHKNTTLLIAHSHTAFSDLKDVRIGDTIDYNGTIYNIYKSEIAEKSSISMKQLLKKNEKDTVILMTCYGNIYPNGDASHRLIIFASRA